MLCTPVTLSKQLKILLRFFGFGFLHVNDMCGLVIKICRIIKLDDYFGSVHKLLCAK